MLREPLTPADARKLIRERIQEAVAKVDSIQPLTVDGPVTVEIEREKPGPEELRPGWERVDAFTVRYTGESFWDVFCAYRGAPGTPPPAGAGGNAN